MASGRSALPERRGIMYTFHSRVRYSEIDADGHITLDNIINYMQDCSTFHSEDLDAENTLDNPYKIVPEEKTIEINNNTISTTINGMTFAIYKFNI